MNKHITYPHKVAVKNASTEDGTTHRVGRTGDIFSRRTERWNKRHMAKVRTLIRCTLFGRH